jgi:uroporphyrinogen decarboxylase
METLGRNGGYLIGPSHTIEPEVPFENVQAFKDALEEFGRY